MRIRYWVPSCHGEVQKYGFYMPESWGSVTIGAPVINQYGLIFIGALDLKTGATSDDASWNPRSLIKTRSVS